MRMKKCLSAILILFLLLFACSCSPQSAPKAQVHFIDVGQADAILIVSGGAAVLIDAGTNSAGQSVLDYIKAQGVSKIDFLIGTHPHEDHIGGLGHNHKRAGYRPGDYAAAFIQYSDL